jgi:peptidoglycan/LPS O-acetylase OafA/YrhL
LHENIGWSIQLQLLKRGFDINMTVIVTLAIGLALATALTYAVEKPAMQWIRTYYKNYSKKI